MLNHVALQCWILFAASLLFPQGAAAGYLQDRNRALIFYTLQADPCYRLSTTTNHDITEAVNSACEEAFIALDRFEGNSCHGWRQAACRQISEAGHFECSCTISSCTTYGIRSHKATPFRDCAWKFYAEQIFFGVAPVPTLNFRQTQETIFEEAVERARLRRQLARASSAAGTSRAPQASFAGGSSSGTWSVQGGSTSGNVGLPVAADTLYGAGVLEPGMGPGFYVCNICRRRYPTIQSLKDHEKSHRPKLRCSYCNGTFSNKGNLHQHLRQIHDIPESEIVQEVNEGPHVCEACGKTFQLLNSLTAHRKVHEEDVTCKACNQSFSTKGNLKKHMKRVHAVKSGRKEDMIPTQPLQPGESSTTPAVKRHVCDQCGAPFAHKKSLQEHMAVHRGETFCDQCNRYFPRIAALNMHKRKMHPESRLN